jgi:hypothetical protein
MGISRQKKEENMSIEFGTKTNPLMESLGLAELTHEAKGNRMRAKAV